LPLRRGQPRRRVEKPDELAFTRDQLRDVRQFVSDHARAAGTGERRAADFTLAVSEVAANSVRHGGGGGTVRMWREPDGLLCEVHDEGQMHDLLAGRLRPALADIGGRGLWLVNHLCDLVQIRSSGGGTVVRLHLALIPTEA
jgi:anti-sigma regulatory factor (Ser/Thr protein kinase)